MNIKSIGTARLLVLYRRLRSCLWHRDYDDMEWNETTKDISLLEAMKAELDTREHVCKRVPIRKEKKVMKYKR